MSDDGYEDDFEQYSDDGFEAEEDDYEVLPKNMAQPSPAPANSMPARTGTATGQRSSNMGPNTGGRPASSGIGTATSLQLPIAAGLTDAQRKAARRKLGEALKRMSQVKLEVVAIDDLFGMAPLSTYDLFSMGRSIFATRNTSSCQTNDDAQEEEMQTDEVLTRGYASQVPDDLTSTPGSSGADEGHTNGTSAQGRMAMRITQMEAGMEVRLSNFLRTAGPVMLAALGLTPSNKSIAILPTSTDPHALSVGVVCLSFDLLLNQRSVTCTSYAMGNEPFLLAAYGPVGMQNGPEALLQDHELSGKGVMCVWDLSTPSSPHAVLVSEGAPAVCCWAPAPATNLVFAGQEEGGVCVWDLEEPASNHPSEMLGSIKVTLRRPSYSTEGSADISTSAAPIVALAPIAKSGGRSTPCQLVTLSCWGDVSVYTVNVMAGGDMAAADTDLGIRIGSKVRLLKTSSNIRLGMQVLQAITNRKPDGFQVRQTFSLAALPSVEHARQFLVGADGGKVLRGSWVGAAPAPKEYIADDHKSAAACSTKGPAIPTCVTALHVSPFCSAAFLAGHDDGTVVLHRLDEAPAVLLFPEVAGSRIRVLRWSPVRPAMFFVLDDYSNLHCFDLTISRTGPVHVEALVSAGKAKAMHFEVAVMQSGTNGQGTASFCVGYDDGHVDCHVFGSRFHSISGSDELRQVRNLLGFKAQKSERQKSEKESRSSNSPQPLRCNAESLQ